MNGVKTSKATRQCYEGEAVGAGLGGWGLQNFVN